MQYNEYKRNVEQKSGLSPNSHRILDHNRNLFFLALTVPGSLLRLLAFADTYSTLAPTKSTMHSVYKDMMSSMAENIVVL